ncbi:Protoporphyrinogen oxidase [Novipirellula galeiformis]|uniref:Coproporphyrinogen III oxidase n=1 Tax=Novipirellula galeiformis TaxID=2528004 RepID=A0A5C6CFL2_9BACT|nr:protoporphyrinogen oxidase [Novipirellula galeiformis]TWU23088.1 Protoporphyrinogen oxidase [Novipirellula galeiformis]
MSKETELAVAIIGGGLSGLATAVHLHLKNPERKIVLLESSDRVGGVIHTETIDGFVLDYGADMFALNPPAAIDLCRTLGAQERLILPNEKGRGAMIVHRGKLKPLPDGFVLMRATKMLPMLTTGLLSLKGKLRMLAESVVPKRTSDDDESVASFVRRRLGNEVLQQIVGPLVAGIYTADVETLSMQATMKPFVEMERQYGSLTRATLSRRSSGEDSVERNSTGARYEQFRAFQGGMIELPKMLCDALPMDTIRLQCGAQSIERLDNQWLVRDTRGGSGLYHHVVLATPPRISARFLQNIAPAAAAELSAIQAASTAIAVMVVRREDIADPRAMFGFVVPPIEKRKILAASFASEKFAGRAPHDHVIVRVFIGGALQRELLQHDDNTLIEIARAELAELIGLRGTPVLTRVVRWNDAMPQYTLGHVERVRRIRDSMATVPGIHLVSNSLDGVGIAPVIGAAEKLATTINDADAT